MMPEGISNHLIVATVAGYFLMFSVPIMLPAIFIKLVGFKGLRNLFSYEPRATVVHRLDPRIKLIYPLVVGVLSVPLNWSYVYGLACITLVPWFLMRPSPQRIRVILVMSISPAIGMVWSQGIFHTTGIAVSPTDLLFRMPPTLAWLGTPGLQRSGLVYGAQEAGRMLVTVSATLLLIMTTKPSDIIWAARKFGLPASAGLALSVALRFLPKMFERLTTLLQAMEVRGYDFNAPSWWQVYLWPDYIRRVLVSIPTVTVPLLIGSLRETSVMAMVADARAFGVSKTRTTYREHEVTVIDKVTWLLLSGLSVLVILMLLFHVGNRQSIG